MVHGIDPTPGNLQADENDYFDEQFSNNHVNSYESVFSINSIHYVSLKDFKNRYYKTGFFKNRLLLRYEWTRLP